MSDHGLDRSLVQVRIKRNPILRHVLAHLHQAISLAADGYCDAAHNCLSEIEDSIFFEDDDELERQAKKWLIPPVIKHVSKGSAEQENLDQESR